MPVPSITPASRVIAGPKQVSCKFEGEAALLQMEDGVYYGLDTVGARVWDLLQQQRTVSELCAQMCAEFDVDSETCERDLLELLQSLADARLIEIH